MALEPREARAEDDESAELRDMSRRFWFAVALAAPLLLTAKSDLVTRHVTSKLGPLEPSPRTVALRHVAPG